MVTIGIVDAEADVVCVEIKRGTAVIEVLAKVADWSDTRLHLTTAHIQGGYRGILGRPGLNQIAAAILEQCNVDELIVEGAIRTTGRRRGQAPTFRYPAHRRLVDDAGT